MATYLDLLKLIDKGMSLDEIKSELKLPAWRIRRILAGIRLDQHLELERKLSQIAVGHALAAGAQQMQWRCVEIAQSSNGETARKAVKELLDQARAHNEAADQAAQDAEDFEDEDEPHVFPWPRSYPNPPHDEEKQDPAVSGNVTHAYRNT